MTYESKNSNNGKATTTLSRAKPYCTVGGDKNMME